MLAGYYKQLGVSSQSGFLKRSDRFNDRKIPSLSYDATGKKKSVCYLHKAARVGSPYLWGGSLRKNRPLWSDEGVRGSTTVSGIWLGLGLEMGQSHKVVFHLDFP